MKPYIKTYKYSCWTNLIVSYFAAAIPFSFSFPVKFKALVGKKIVLLTKKEEIICLPAYVPDIHLPAKYNQSPDRPRISALSLHPPFLKCYFHLFFTPIPGIFTNLASRLRCAKHHSLSLDVQPLMGDKPVPGAQPPTSRPGPSSPQPSSPTA